MDGVGVYTTDQGTYTGQFKANWMDGISKFYDKRTALTTYIYSENVRCGIIDFSDDEPHGLNSFPITIDIFDNRAK